MLMFLVVDFSEIGWLSTLPDGQSIIHTLEVVRYIRNGMGKLIGLCQCSGLDFRFGLKGYFILFLSVRVGRSFAHLSTITVSPCPSVSEWISFRLGVVSGESDWLTDCEGQMEMRWTRAVDARTLMACHGTVKNELRRGDHPVQRTGTELKGTLNTEQ